MNAGVLKQEAATAAMQYIRPLLNAHSVIGVGTGSTTDCFIDLLSEIKQFFNFTVSSSERSTERLKTFDIPVVDANDAKKIDFYIDGADEVDPSNALIKGGGGALTQEKIVASASEIFICIVDESKVVDQLGEFPLPIEVIPSATSVVTRQLNSLGGRVSVRSSYSDNHNRILDVQDLHIVDPDGLEQQLNNIAGVVTTGIFAIHRPHTVIISTQTGVEIRS